MALHCCSYKAVGPTGRHSRRARCTVPSVCLVARIATGPHLSPRQASQAATARAPLPPLSAVLKEVSGPGHTPWFEKKKELWLEITTEEELINAQLNLPPGKLLLVDFYAGWCAVCKSAYPALCRWAAAKELNSRFVFAKASIDNQDIRALIKKEGIGGIPYMCIYSPTRAKVAAFGASFKKLEVVKKNLAFLSTFEGSLDDLRLDPNAFLFVPEGPSALEASGLSVDLPVTATASASSSSI